MIDRFRHFLRGTLHRLRRCPTYHHLSSGVEGPAGRRARRVQGGIDGAMWVVSRKLCRCTDFPVPGLTSRQRASALALKLKQASPFPHSGAYGAVSGDHAQLWYWDQARVDSAARELGIDPATLWVVPESLLLPAPTSGARLVRCREGVEGQWWSNGRMLSSQWWPEPPAQDEWSMFVRQLGAAGADAPATAPALTVLDQLQLPEAANALSGSDPGSRAASERLAYTLGAAALLLWGSWLGGSWLKVETEARRIASETLGQREAAAPSVRARQDASDDAGYLDSFASIAAYPDPRLVLAALARALPADGTSVGDFDLRDGNLRAQLIAASANPPIAALVNSLNESGVLAAAKANTELGGRTLIVTASVVKLPAAR